MSNLKRQAAISGKDVPTSPRATSPTLAARKRRRVSQDQPEAGSSIRDTALNTRTSGLGPAIRQQLEPNVSAQSKGAENGIIESITCTNFMCHSHLHVDLGPLINFVIGHNGSGKSAVLTALTICLGGKASSTNRASTLKAFIKEGQDSSTLTVRIKNRDGYQHDVYGDSIVVERTFTRGGTSGFKLKGAGGRIISTTKSTLDEVLDYYALQLDNPICVLSQDMARQFLHSSTAAEKYRFFIKGVQLEQMNQDYDLLSENIESIEGTFDTKERKLKELQERDLLAKERVNMLEKQEETNRQVNELSAQMAWAQVIEEETRLAEIVAQILQASEVVFNAESSISEATVAFESACRDLEESKSREEAIEGELAPIREILEQVKIVQNDAERELQEQRVEHRKIHERIQRARETEQNRRREISEEEARLVDASGSAATSRLEHYKTCKAACDEAQRVMDNAKSKGGTFITQESNAKKAWTEARQDQAAKGEELAQAQQRLKALEQSGPRQEYPSNMDRLLDLIASDRGFREKPVGPLANHMSLSQPVWAPVLEKTFGNVLNSFVVTSKQDRDRLNDLMKSCYCMCPINIQPASSRFDIGNNEPVSHLTTIARVLRINNDMVFNYLVINQRIEQLLLIENEVEATRLMSSQRLRNVKACYTRDQTDRSIAHSLTWGVSGGLSSTFLELARAPSRIKIDRKDQLDAQANIVRHLETNSRESENRCLDLRRAYEGSIKARQQHSKIVDELRSNFGSAVEEKEKAEEDMNRGTIEEGRLAALQEGLDVVMKEITDSEYAFEVCLKAKDSAKQAFKVQEVKKRQVELQLQDCEARLGKAQSLRQIKEQARLESLQRKNQTHAGYDQAIEDRTRLQSAEKAQADKVRDFERQALDVAQRCDIPEGETLRSIDARLEKLVAEVDRFFSKLGGSREKLTREYANAHAAYTAFFRAFEQERDLLVLLKKTLSERQERWRLFRKHIAARAKTKFMYLLTERAFTGELLVDHSRRLMDLKVQPDETKASAPGRQTKTLSGGEKSFSTICLLLALWEAIGAPIRCLDEFDVFMDNANRDISMKLLISAARGAHDRQFIFITPQSMASIDRAHDVKIIKMRDPERGQTILPHTYAR